MNTASKPSGMAPAAAPAAAKTSAQSSAPAAAKTSKEDAAPAKRQSSLPLEAVRQAFSGTASTVQAVADKLKIKPKAVRSSIDALRRQNSKAYIERTAPQTFIVRPNHAAKKS